MKIFKIALIFLLFLSVFSSEVKAVYDPLSLPNNKFGIHVIDENDLENAASLVNSSGGDWGYVTMVIAENDRSVDKWQNTFDRLRKYHLIPIIRLATETEGDFWQKPVLENINSWVDFLDSLKWNTQNRYVILFNEPNHAKEWGGWLDPEGYADTIKQFSQRLKAKSPDFFVLPAGFDASAPNSYITMDEANFIYRMVQSSPDIFDFIDGWTSHSYPNPGFTGKLEAQGRGTLRTYIWELNLIRKYGCQKNLPVFITETGWPHAEGTNINTAYYNSQDVANFMVAAASTIWTDGRIVALTPFLLNYQSYPFSNFSWQKPGNEGFYPQYDAWKAIPKTAGQPVLVKLPEPTSMPSPTPQVLGMQNQSDKSLLHKDNTNEIPVISSFWQFMVKSIFRLIGSSTISSDK